MAKANRITTVGLFRYPETLHVVVIRYNKTTHKVQDRLYLVSERSVKRMVSALENRMRTSGGKVIPTAHGWAATSL